MRKLLARLKSRYGAEHFARLEMESALLSPDVGSALFTGARAMGDSGIAVIMAAESGLRRALLQNALRLLVGGERTPVLCALRHVTDAELMDGLFRMESGRSLAGGRGREEYRRGRRHLDPYTDGLLYPREIAPSVEDLERYAKGGPAGGGLGALVADDPAALSCGDPELFLLGLKRFSIACGVPAFLIVAPGMLPLDHGRAADYVESILEVSAGTRGAGPIALSVEVRKPAGLALELVLHAPSGIIEPAAGKTPGDAGPALP